MPEPIQCPRCASRRVQSNVSTARKGTLLLLVLPLCLLGIVMFFILLLPRSNSEADMLLFLMLLMGLIMSGSVMLILLGSARNKPGGSIVRYHCLDCQTRWSVPNGARTAVQKAIHTLQTREQDETPAWVEDLLAQGPSTAAGQAPAPDRLAAGCPHCGSQRVTPYASRIRQQLTFLLMLPLCLLSMVWPNLWGPDGAGQGLVRTLLSMGSFTLVILLMMAVMQSAQRALAGDQRQFRCLDCNRRFRTSGKARELLPTTAQKRPAPNDEALAWLENMAASNQQPPANRPTPDVGPDADDSWFDQLTKR